MSDQKGLTNELQGERERLESSMAFVLRQFSVNTDGMIPAIVESYDRSRNIAVVRPVIMWVTAQDTPLARKPFAEINVLSIGGGGYHLNFPIKPGDLGWLIASDRDLSNFRQSLQEGAPATGRLHKFESGMFIPDVFRQYTISGEDSDSLVLQSTSSASRIAVRQNEIKITTPTKVILDTPDTEITGNVKIVGDTVIQSTLSVTGDTTLTGEATVKGIAVSTHGHISSTPGQRTGGGMIA